MNFEESNEKTSGTITKFFQGGSVCCIDYVRENQGALEDKDYSVEPSNHPPRQQYHLSHSKNPYIIEQDSDEIGINYERKKHSISDSSYSEADRIGSNPIDGSNEELDRFGRIPNNLYKGVGNFNRPVKRGDLLKYNGRRQDSQFVPPGLAKKKPWKEEKITDYDFYNEYDPTKLQGPNGPHHRGPDNYNSNDHYLETDRPSQWEDNKPQWSSEGERPNGRPEWPNQGKRTSKRPPWSNQGKRTNAPPGWHGQNPNSHNNHWTTTKHNKWPQETTTVRNEYSGSNGKPHGNKHTTRRPPKTTTEPDQHNIWPSEQSSRPQENQSIVTPDSPGKLRISELSKH